MPPPKTIFSIREVADLTRTSKTFVYNQILSGQLRAGRAVSSAGGDGRFQVRRADLIPWLLTGQFDLRYVRKILNGDADVVLVRTRPSLQSNLMRYERAVAVDSLFKLGLLMTEWRVWAVVVDLPAVGSREAVAAFADLAPKVDRPELIGLYADEVAARPEVVEVFDALFPLSRRDDALARAIAELNPHRIPVDTGSAP